MKASIKFREDQKPLLRAKVPISILSFPFQSGIAAGDSKELSLSLRTFFDAGPSLRFSYRPNDSQKPFSFVLKTGIGHFGSPDSSPFTMSAEFNLIGNQNPSFFVHFKPRFGDFCVKKSHSSSDLAKSFSSDSKLNGAREVLAAKVIDNHPNFFDPKFRVPTPESAVNGVVEKLFSGATVSARTSLPLKSRAVVSFCWGLRFFPLESREDDGVLVGKKTDHMANISFRNLPLLVMNKICIEHVAAKDNSKKGGNADVAEEPSLKLQRQLELIQAEIGLLRNAQNDFRAEMVDSERKGSKFNPGGRGSIPDKKQSDGLKEKTSDDLNGKLKKAI